MMPNPDAGALVVPEPDCPNAAEHTPCPSGHVDWFVWAEEMGKTHQPTHCSSCGRFVIWVPNSEESGRSTGESA